MTVVSHGTPLPPIAVETGGDIEQRVDDEGVEPGDDRELDQKLVEGGAHRWPAEEDDRDRDCAQGEIHDGAGGRDDGLLDLGEAAGAVGDISRKAVKAEVEHPAAEPPYGDGVPELMERDRDGNQHEERGLIDDLAIEHREVVVPDPLPVLDKLRNDADPDDHVDQANDGEGTEIHNTPGLKQAARHVAFVCGSV
jgi:hypothetical protein